MVADNKKVDLSIIYPAFNEEINVTHIPEELIKYADELGLEYEILLVDDGSRDNTYKNALELSSKYPQINILQHEKNMGLGMAIRTGINNTKGTLLITLDADFTFHPRQIKSLLDRFNQGDVDCVIGSPALYGYGKDIPLYRVILSMAVNNLYKFLLGQKVTAISPIFRLYKSDQVKELPLTSNNFDINAEILFKLLQTKRKVAEIPAELTTREFGESKIDNVREIRNHLKLLSKVFKYRLSGYKSFRVENMGKSGNRSVG